MSLRESISSTSTVMATLLPASQTSTFSGYRDTFSGNSGKRKRTSGSIRTTLRSTKPAQVTTSRAAVSKPNAGKGPRQRSSERSVNKGRQNSLRRVQGSTDRLRDLSNKTIIPGGNSGGREGRQFTVANVGNNGRIYLRYARIFVTRGIWQFGGFNVPYSYMSNSSHSIDLSNVP